MSPISNIGMLSLLPWLDVYVKEIEYSLGMGARGHIFIILELPLLSKATYNRHRMLI